MIMISKNDYAKICDRLNATVFNQQWRLPVHSRGLFALVVIFFKSASCRYAIGQINLKPELLTQAQNNTQVIKALIHI